MTSTTQRLNVRSRIYLSTGLLVAVCCIASGIGWYGQTSLLRNITDYERAESTAFHVLEIDRSIQELKVKSESYIYSGSESTRRDAERMHQRIITQIDAIASLSSDTEFGAMLREMKRHLLMFGEQLQLAADERATRSSLITDQLPRQAHQVRMSIERLQDLADRQHPEISRSKLIDLVREFGDGRQHMLRYVINPRSAHFDLMLSAIRRSKSIVDSIQTDDSSELAACRTQLSTRLSEYERLAFRAVEATSRYLHYANVMMAAEISEFARCSNKVKNFVHQEQQQNRLARSDAATRMRTLSVITCLTALVSASVLATGLSYSIVRPISKLTDALRRLASGETVDNIPGTERGDEIGRMARAARVFSAKNRQTEDLLARSQLLSNELASKAKALEETNLELDNFAYVASHDLKAPLRGINSLAEWVQEDCEEFLPDDSKAYLAQMQDRVNKMDTLLNDLLEYSRVGRTRQLLESIDLDTLVQSVITMIDNPQHVSIDVAEPLPQLHTAISPLKGVLLNLITNAVKYNDKGLDGRIRVSCEDAGDCYAIAVADNGIGIDSRHYERIFQMYQRVAPPDVDGSGMGLAIVKKQVESYGGSVTVESQCGMGSTFVVRWPKVLDLKDDDTNSSVETFPEPTAQLAASGEGAR